MAGPSLTSWIPEHWIKLIYLGDVYLLIMECTGVSSSERYSILSVLRSCKSAPLAYISDQNLMKTVEF